MGTLLQNWWRELLTLCIIGVILVVILAVKTKVQPPITIQQASQSLALEIMQQDPNVVSVGVGQEGLIVSLRSPSKTDFPKEYQGFPVVIQVMGDIKVQTLE